MNNPNLIEQLSAPARVGWSAWFGGLLVLLTCWVFWWDIRQGVILRCLDAVEWIIDKLHWCVRKDAELRAKLKELEEKKK